MIVDNYIVAYYNKLIKLTSFAFKGVNTLLRCQSPAQTAFHVTEFCRLNHTCYFQVLLKKIMFRLRYNALLTPAQYKKYLITADFMPYPSDVLRQLKFPNWKNTDYVTFNDTGQCEKTCQFPDRCVHSKCFETLVPSNSPILRGQPYAPHPFILKPPRTEQFSVKLMSCWFFFAQKFAL